MLVDLRRLQLNKVDQYFLKMETGKDECYKIFLHSSELS